MRYQFDDIAVVGPIMDAFAVLSFSGDPTPSPDPDPDPK